MDLAIRLSASILIAILHGTTGGGWSLGGDDECMIFFPDAIEKLRRGRIMDEDGV